MIITYWSCSNNHIVLNWYMPQSGVTCNVMGCDEERTQKTIDLDYPQYLRDPIKDLEELLNDSDGDDGTWKLLSAYWIELYLIKDILNKLKELDEN